MIGQVISHYRIVSQLGAGGMGIVYGAEDTLLGRPVALKFVSADAATDRQAVERLRIEARAASALNHANICTIYEFGEHEGRPFIVMELMKGRTLRDRLTSGALAIHQVVEMGIQIADALDAAHSQGIMHRDIKPANVFLTERGQVKILDFGLAKLLPKHNAFETTATPLASDQLTQAGVAIGTVLYMSPEQATGEDLDGRTDLFSFGVVLYECVTGRRPFAGKTAAVVLDQILNRAPVAASTYVPELPGRLQDVINNCLEKDRELRYQSADALRADLKRIRRDMESGHIASAASAASLRGDAGVSGTARKVRATSASQDLPSEASPRSISPMAWLGGAAALLAVGALFYFQPWKQAAPIPQEVAQTAQAPGPSDMLVQTRLELAETSLKAKDYSAAITYADEVLRAVPGHAGATKIREDAQATLARFEQALADARRLLAAEDAEGARRALERARAINPSSPALVELSAALVDHFKGQADAARQRSKAATQVPVAPTPKPTERAAAPVPPPAQTAPPQVAAPPARSEPVQTPPPPVTTPPSPAPVTRAPEPATRPAEPATRPAEPATRPAEPAPTPPPVANTERRERAADPPAKPVEDDDAAIRRVIATYGRAIETKNLALFRSVKPNLSADEERRITAGFRSVASQQVAITILSIDRKGDNAVVRLRRRDTVVAGGRQQIAEAQQTITLSKHGNWAIEQIGQ
jgi:predicted Ser/Thr protein kinase/tetratricopeptide (TPR) repeat protein